MKADHGAVQAAHGEGRNGGGDGAHGPHVNWRTLDLNLLVVFDAVAAERNITRASIKLNMSQSAASHAMTRLRHALRDDLFLRTPTGMEPTAFAATLIEPIHTALGVVRAALESPAFDPTTARRDFCVAMDNRSALVLAAPLGTYVAREAPLVGLEIRPTGRLDIADQLDRGGLDIAVSCQPADRDRFDSRKLFDDGFVVVLRREHPAASADTIDLPSLAAYPHLSLSSVSEEDTFVDEHLAHEGLARHVALRAPLHSASSILTTSDMLTIMGERTAHGFRDAEILRVLRLPFASPQTTTSMLWHRRWNRAPAHRWLRKAIASIADGMSD